MCYVWEWRQFREYRTRKIGGIRCKQPLPSLYNCYHLSASDFLRLALHWWNNSKFCFTYLIVVLKLVCLTSIICWGDSAADLMSVSMLRKKNTCGQYVNVKSGVSGVTYQPLSISETIWSPEHGLRCALSLELDENAWKISNQKENKNKRLFIRTEEPSTKQPRPRMKRRGKM